MTYLQTAPGYLGEFEIGQPQLMIIWTLCINHSRLTLSSSNTFILFQPVNFFFFFFLSLHLLKR